MGRRLKQGLEWFRLDAGFPEHPKVMQLARDLKVPLLSARGLLVTLWCWTARYFPTGILKGVSDQEIATAAGYRGRKALADFLRKRGLLDNVRGGGMRVHGWIERQGPDLRQREAERDRKRRTRAKARKANQPVQDCPPDNPRTSGGTVPGTSAGQRVGHPQDVGGTGPTGKEALQKPEPERKGVSNSKAEVRRRKAALARLFDKDQFPKTATARQALLPAIALVLTSGRAVTLEDQEKWTAILQKALRKETPIGWAVDVLADAKWSPADEDRQPARAEVLEDRHERAAVRQAHGPERSRGEETTSLGQTLRETVGAG